MTKVLLCLVATLAVASTSSSAQVAVYDEASATLTIPYVKVGDLTYWNVRLRNIGNYVFDLAEARPSPVGGFGTTVYDLATNVLTVPSVKVGTTTFLDVRLLNVGNYRFTLQAAAQLPQVTADEVGSFFAQFDAQWANAVPSTGAQRAALLDACYLDDGRTKAWLIADADANRTLYSQRDAYKVGMRSANLQVTALRSLGNPDGSVRREIDVTYDAIYRGNTVQAGAKATLISGSSAGTCGTPQLGSGLRILGNRQLIGTDVRARNIRDEQRSITTGAPLNPAVVYGRRIQFSISDPLGNAKYVIVSGVGPTGNVNGRTVPFSLKFLSTKLLSSAAELRGKPGNFLNWRDDDSWRFCRVNDSALPLAQLADCAGQGATSFDWGVYASTSLAAADSSFNAQRWDDWTFRFDVYNDDGWKVVNGHVGRTPVATYFTSLSALPLTLVQMAGSGPSADLFPRLNFGALSHAQVVSNFLSATPAAIGVTWNRVPQTFENRNWALASAWEFHQGPAVGNLNSAFNPGYRTITYNYPAAGSTVQSIWPVTAKQPGQVLKTYVEFAVLYSDRNDSQIISIVSFR